MRKSVDKLAEIPAKLVPQLVQGLLKQRKVE